MILDYFAEMECDDEDKIVLVSSSTLVAMHLAIFIKRKYVPFVANIHTEALPLGFKGHLGTKGAQNISFCFGGIRMLFINCHLQAHIKGETMRNEHWAQINT